MGAWPAPEWDGAACCCIRTVAYPAQRRASCLASRLARRDNARWPGWPAARRGARARGGVGRAPGGEGRGDCPPQTCNALSCPALSVSTYPRSCPQAGAPTWSGEGGAGHRRAQGHGPGGRRRDDGGGQGGIQHSLRLSHRSEVARNGGEVPGRRHGLLGLLLRLLCSARQQGVRGVGGRWCSAEAVPHRDVCPGWGPPQAKRVAAGRREGVQGRRGLCARPRRG